ncbi:MAG: hypothetical protein IPK82_31895 [Polyangiaceae bacterium]|nr:hypothetical protein [Polyangiaceae bacterium]
MLIVSKEAMRPFRIATFLPVVFGACSGQYEYVPTISEPDPPGTAVATSAQAGAESCVAEAIEIAPTGPEAARPCCAGLTRANVYKGSILRLDQCVPTDDGHAFCIRCGDGHCGVGESVCSCEIDCRWP